MKLTKRLLALLVALILLSASVTALAQAEKIQIEFWNFFGGNDGAYMTRIVDEFNAMQDEYFINMSTQDFASFYVKLKTSVLGNEGPDFSTCHDDYVWGLVKSGLLIPIDAAAQARGVEIQWENYINKLDMLRYDGTIYAVPLDGVLRILYYNKTICEKAGLLDADGKLNIGTGMDDWVTAMEKVKAAGFAPFVTREKGSHPVYLFNALYYQFGGQQPWIADDGAEVTIEQDIAVKALEAYRTILSYNYEGVDDVGEIFTAGNTAFCIDQSAAAATYQTALGDSFGCESMYQFGQERLTAMFSHTFTMPVSKTRTPEQEKGILEFIKWFGENNMKWAACGHIPANKLALESEEFKASELHQMYKDSTEMATMSLSYGAPIAMKGSAEMNDPLYLVGRGEVTAEEGYTLILENLTNLLADYE